MGVHLHTRCTSAKTAPECGCYQIVFQGSDLNVYYITFTLSIVQGRLYEEAEGKSELLKINRKKKRANDIISSFVMPLCIFEIFIAKACSYVEAAHHRVFFCKRNACVLAIKMIALNVIFSLLMFWEVGRMTLCCNILYLSRSVFRKSWTFASFMCIFVLICVKDVIAIFPRMMFRFLFLLSHKEAACYKTGSPVD